MDYQRPLDRREASQYLLERHGIKRSPATLAKLASIGGGPLYRRAGRRRVIYDPPHLDEYAANILSAPATSSAEHDALRTANVRASTGGRLSKVFELAPDGSIRTSSPEIGQLL